MSYSTDIQNIKHAVLKEVANFAFDGTLNEKKDDIPYIVIPGIKPNFRCCVFKEREVIRQRVRLAMGELPTGSNSNIEHKSKNIVHVIAEGCEGCPLSRFHVTPNCQKCIAKKCVKACSFGAISITAQGAFIDQDKCRECGRCAKVCPYNAISDLVRPCKAACPVNAISYDENKIAKIEEEKCINCGACVRNCPFGAISDVSFMVEVIESIKNSQKYEEFSQNQKTDAQKTFAIFAPAIEGQFGNNVTVTMLKSALRKLGFTDAFEVSLGADATAYYEAQELIEHKEEGKKMTTSCCPAFKEMIRIHFPEIYNLVSTTRSPMAALSAYLKQEYENCKVVFIGPCIAKKNEIKNFGIENNADLVLTCEELYSMFDSQGIDFDKMDSDIDDGTLYGKEFAISGGVAAAVIKVLEEQGYSEKVSAQKCNGGSDCKKALAMLKAGKFPDDILEGMACEMGCIGGPGIIEDPLVTKRNRAVLLSGATKHNITKNIKETYDFSKIEMYTHNE